jgi:acetoin:2,6-dichlorophenolindophenol oxidoreductase subunit alpha
LRNWLTAQNYASETQLEAVAAETKSTIDAAVQFALTAPYPDPGEVQQDVYA